MKSHLLLFTLFLSAVKLLQVKADRDWLFLYLISFFEVLLAAGLTITPDRAPFQVPIAVTASLVKVTPNSVKVWLACEWPEGTQCPGQLALRTRIKIALPHRRGTPPRIRAVTRSLGRRAFNLTGKRGHGFVIPLSAGARALLKQRGSLKAQLITAIPGGRRVLAVPLSR